MKNLNKNCSSVLKSKFFPWTGSLFSMGLFSLCLLIGTPATLANVMSSTKKPQVAEDNYISRTGYSSGICDGSNANFCIDQIKQNAQRDTERDADIECRIKNGNLDRWSRSCYDSCTPSYIPYNGKPESVRCSSTCNYICKTAK